VVIDTREQLAWSFAGMQADAIDGRRPIQVACVRACLPSGDYSLLGFENRIAIERKSLQDLFSTIGQGRARFERELARLAVMEAADVVVEADWQTVIETPPERSQLPPKVVFRSVIAWRLRYPRCHWWFMPGRALAERVTFRLLQRFYRVNSAG
jgi:ERCC4-type nuclease